MDGPSGFEILARLVPTLVVLLGALYGVRWLAQRNARTAGGGGQAVRVVSRTGLSRGALLAVIEVQGRQLLVGATEHGINLLAELEPEQDAPGAVFSLAGMEPADFPGTSSGMLAGTDLARLRSASLSGTTPGTSNRPRSGLVDRLRDMTVRSTPGPGRGSR